MIRLEGIEKAFRSDFLRRRRPVLNGLRLHVSAGETYALLGANGAGKTTTMKILLDLIRPDRGEASIGGIPSTDPRSRKKVGFLPEHPYFFPHLTGEELVRYYGRLSGLSRAEANAGAVRWLDRVRLGDARKRRIRTYSKGMLQRVGFAQALTGDPELLILDEPFSGLDPVGRREFRDLLDGLKAEGKTILFSSHILEDVERLCDRAGFVDRGRIVREMMGSGSVRIEVFADGIEPEALEAGGVIAEKIVRAGENVAISLRDESDLPLLSRSVKEWGGKIIRIEKKGESLEEAFLEHVAARENSGD